MSGLQGTQMVKSVLMKSEEKFNHRKKRLFINILLTLWMSAILALQIILYPSRAILNIAEKLQLREPILALRKEILPYFQTSDLNTEFTEIFND